MICLKRPGVASVCARSLSLLCAICASCSGVWARPGEAAPLPGYEELATGVHAVRLLPRAGQFVFTLYGTPGDLDTVRQLVRVMRERGLGNGFDPGPGPQAQAGPVCEFLAENRWPVEFYSGAEMQIKGGLGISTWSTPANISMSF